MGAVHCLVGRGHRLEAGADVGLKSLYELDDLALVQSEYSDRFQVAHGVQGEQLRAGLHARADQRRNSGVRSGQQVRRGPNRGSGPPCG